MEGRVSIPFIDANIIMYTVGKEHRYKEPCSVLVKRIAEENIVVASDTEVLQEILYRYWLIREFRKARETYNDFKKLISLMFPVTIDDVGLAQELLEENGDIKPRDAIHAAIMLNNGLTRIYSTDAHFDEIRGIERIDPVDLNLEAQSSKRSAK